jgi:hypothetical protein
MILTKSALLALKGTDKEFKGKLADELRTSINSLYRHIEQNQDNGKLTTVKAVSMISEETGLKYEQILMEPIVNIRQTAA